MAYPNDAVGRTTVLYVGGLGRSGSTLLDRMLGQVPGMVSAGELVHLWRRGVTDDERCGCGERFSACPFWGRVGELAFGGWDTLSGEQMCALQASVDRTRFLPYLLQPALSRSYAGRLTRFADLLSRLYPAIAEVAGAQVVVDSSKHASYAYLLRRVPTVDLRVLQVVRRVEGVAYSWSKTVERPEVDGEQTMPIVSPVRVGLRWTAQNTLFDVLGRRLGVPTALVRYEDMVRDPRAAVAAALELTGLVGAAGLDFVGDNWVTLGVSHTVAGNPMRFRTGRLELRADEEWRERMESSHRRTVSALTWPVRGRYGYGRRGNAATLRSAEPVLTGTGGQGRPGA